MSQGNTVVKGEPELEAAWKGDSNMEAAFAEAAVNPMEAAFAEASVDPMAAAFAEATANPMEGAFEEATMDPMEAAWVCPQYLPPLCCVAQLTECCSVDRMSDVIHSLLLIDSTFTTIFMCMHAPVGRRFLGRRVE